MTDTNQASEDELDTLMEQLGFLWDSYQSNWRNDGLKQFGRDYDDSISMDLAKQLLAHLRTEKLKAQTAILQEGISESKEFCGEDVDINLGWVNFKLDELQQSLTKLEAEL